MGSDLSGARERSRCGSASNPAPAPPRCIFGPGPTRFDGNEWTPLASGRTRSLRPRARWRTRGTRSHEVTLEPLRLASVPLLEATTEVAAVEGYRLVARDDLQWLAEKPVLERVRFKATASTRFVLGAPRRAAEIQDSLELPIGFNPRTVAWARAFRADPSRRGATPGQLAQAVMQHIRTQGYSYTLSPGDYGRNGITSSGSTQ